MATSRPPFTIYPARRILTMDRTLPVADAVAVLDGRILGVGDTATLATWGTHRVDDRYADCVLMPGLIEGHSHLLEGGIWDYPYLGFYQRRSPDGSTWPALRSIDAVVERLQQAELDLRDSKAPLVAWGFDPILFRGPRMVLADLDRVSKQRPIAVIHSNFHVLNANSAMLKQVGITRDTDVDGIVRDDRGEPTGELAEMAAMFPVFQRIGDPFRAGRTERAVWNFARLAQAVGVTTAADLTNDLSDESVGSLQAATVREDFPLRIVAAFFGLGIDPRAGIEQVRARQRLDSAKLRFGPVKLMTDGSIQAFTARIKWPGYYNGHPNGIWNIAPAQLHDVVAAYHEAGLQLHIHVNGDEASEVTIAALGAAIARKPRPDHRHTLQHLQMADEAQFRRIRALDLCVNLFANHIFHWGDIHHDVTMGPERAHRMDAAGSALAHGIPFSVHSDAPITPLAPLFSAWCAVNRITASGRVLGPNQRISVADALRAVTLGSAYTLHIDDEVGSIEVGKRADFAVLADDPLQVPPEGLKDVRVVGTMVGGVHFEPPAGT